MLATPSPLQRRAVWGCMLAVLLVAGLLRLPLLGHLPNGFFTDEASTGYDAYALLHTGADQYGVRWPLFARSVGDYNEALYRYLAVPSVAIFGLNEFAVRLPAALAGILTVALLFAVVREQWGVRVALWAALLLAISPWAVPLNRIAFRANLLPMLFLLGHWALLRAMSRRPAWIYAATLAFGLALVSYSSARMFVPLNLLGFGLIYRRSLGAIGRPVWMAGGAFLALLLALSTYWLSSQGMARARLLGVQGHWSVVWDYLSYFDPRFLVLQGDRDLCHGLIGWGILGPVQGGLALAGLGRVVKDWRNPALRMWVWWLLLYPLPAALAGPGHSLRSIAGAPAFCLLAALGAVGLMGLAKSRVARVAWIALLLVGLAQDAGRFAWQYFTDYPRSGASAWLYGMRELVHEQAAYSGGPIYISNRIPVPFLFVPFYTAMSPREYQALPFLYDDLAKYTGYTMGRFHVIDVAKLGLPEGPCVLTLTAEEAQRYQAQWSDSWSVRHEVRHPDGHELYVLLEHR
ncbi:MAG TPA: glycosyltransferase family 39 protein [Planctomycetota bacterium]|nr:glycosyltransferase family 39 protein [Planctomycetota bacterium]